MLQAYAQAQANAYPAFSADYPAQVVAAESYASADAFDELIGQWLARQPAAPGFSTGNQLAARAPDPLLEQLLITLFSRFGAHSRHAVQATLAAPPASAPAAD